MTVAPRARNSSTADRIASALTGSSPVKGSSRISSFGSGTTAAMNWIFWLMPLLSVCSLRSRAMREAEFLQPRRHFGGYVLAALQLRIKLQQRLDIHLPVQAALFRQISDPRARLRIAFPEHTDFAAVRIENIHDHAHGRGLPRAVRSDESIDRALRNVERQIVHSSYIPEGLTDMRYLYRVHRTLPMPEYNRSIMTPQLLPPGLLPQGYAAAVLPITAATIATDSAGLIAGEVEIPTGDLRIPAYRACPAQGESFPTILVVQEIFGIHEHIKDLCRRFAKLGYFAVAPYLYAREGEVAGLKGIPEIYARVVSKVPDAQVMSDLDATVAWAGKNHGNTKRLAATGFCWGGRIVWLYAAHSVLQRAESRRRMVRETRRRHQPAPTAQSGRHRKRAESPCNRPLRR